MFLLRKVEIQKWSPSNDLAADEAPADSVAADLRSKGNALSFWFCDSDPNDKCNVADAAIAIAAMNNRIDKMHILWVSRDQLVSDGQNLDPKASETPITDMAQRHVDVCKLDSVRLGMVASRIFAAAKSEHYQFFDKKEVTNLLADAVKAGRVTIDQLNEKVEADVRRALGMEPQREI